MSATTTAFNAVFNNTEVKEIQFDPNWANGTGYYDGATAVKLKPGAVAKAVSPMPNNRKILLVGTRLGTVAVFERYTDGANGIYVSNWPKKAGQLQRLVNATSALSADTIATVIGTEFSFDRNIGQFIEAWNKVINDNDEAFDGAEFELLNKAA